MMNKPVIILGSGGHARVLQEMLKKEGSRILGFSVQKVDLCKRNYSSCGLEILGSDEDILKYDPGEIYLVNGIGFTDVCQKRKEIFNFFNKRGYCFKTLIHPSAVVDSSAFIAEGTQVMAGAVIQPFARIGRNVIINTRSSIDHHCSIEDHVHLAPGTTLSGGVKIGESSLVGAGAVVIQGVIVGREATVAAGGVVIDHVPDREMVKGVPAKRRTVK